jgi:hypothetical protein
MIKERIIKVIEFKRIAKEKFYSDIGMTSANFRGKAKETPINSTAIKNILLIIPDLNPDWLIFGKGSMLRCEQRTGNVDNSNVVGSNVSGNGININGTSSELIAIIKKQQDQIDKLLHIIQINK